MSVTCHRCNTRVLLCVTHLPQHIAGFLVVSEAEIGNFNDGIGGGGEEEEVFGLGVQVLQKWSGGRGWAAHLEVEVCDVFGVNVCECSHEGLEESCSRFLVEVSFGEAGDAVREHAGVDVQ